VERGHTTRAIDESAALHEKILLVQDDLKLALTLSNRWRGEEWTPREIRDGAKRGILSFFCSFWEKSRFVNCLFLGR